MTQYFMDDLFAQSATPADYVDGYFARLAALLASVDRDLFSRMIAEFEAVIERGGTIYTLANGGSAAVASHMINDLVAGAFLPDAAPIRAVCLSDNTETVTALSNDNGYEQVFVRQLQVFARPEDLVLVMSVSGNSENLVRAVDYANDKGVPTIAWTGMKGGKLAEKATVAIHANSTPDEYGPIEDLFSIYMHTVVTYLTLKRGKALHH